MYSHIFPLPLTLLAVTVIATFILATHVLYFVILAKFYGRKRKLEAARKKRLGGTIRWDFFST